LRQPPSSPRCYLEIHPLPRDVTSDASHELLRQRDHGLDQATCDQDQSHTPNLENSVWSTPSIPKVPERPQGPAS
jgi:hypothetical protein